MKNYAKSPLARCHVYLATSLIVIPVSLFLLLLMTTDLVASEGQQSAEKMFRKGVNYWYGQCVQQDVSKAASWFQKAAEQGDARAQNNLGFMYEKGRGAPQDYTEAVKWYRKAAEQGLAEAQNNLAGIYDQGVFGGPRFFSGCRMVS